MQGPVVRPVCILLQHVNKMEVYLRCPFVKLNLNQVEFFFYFQLMPHASLLLSCTRVHAVDLTFDTMEKVPSGRCG